MKFLVVLSTLDLKYRMGCTPHWWQLLKALHETGNEVVAIPYLGDAIESVWWRTYPNPCRWESVVYNRYLEARKRRGVSPSSRNILSPAADFYISHVIRPRWEKHLLNITGREKFDVVLFMNVPINHITGIPSKVRKKTGIPVIYYDGDMPTILPKYTIGRGFKFDYYQGAELSEYDAFLTNSKGCIPDLEQMGARNVHAFYYGLDPDLCAPVTVEKDIDIFFFGYGSDFREEWITKMITVPSRAMPDVSFVVAGAKFDIDMGKSQFVGDLSYSAWRQYCCRSKINLNIARWSHASVYASSTARPFELAAFGTCIVSQPYKGIEEWFEIGKELFIVNSEDEAIETYRWLLNHPEIREASGRRARERLLKEHTFRHRAEQLVSWIKDIRI